MLLLRGPGSGMCCGGQGASGSTLWLPEPCCPGETGLCIVLVWSRGWGLGSGLGSGLGVFPPHLAAPCIVLRQPCGTGCPLRSWQQRATLSQLPSQQQEEEMLCCEVGQGPPVLWAAGAWSSVPHVTAVPEAPSWPGRAGACLA